MFRYFLNDCFPFSSFYFSSSQSTERPSVSLQRRPSVPPALQGSMGPHGVTGIIVGPGSQAPASPTLSKSPVAPTQQQLLHQQQQQEYLQHQQQLYQQHTGQQAPQHSKDFLSNMGFELNDFASQTSNLFSDIFGE